MQEGPDALRHGEHPLAHGKRWQDMIDEMGGGLDLMAERILGDGEEPSA